jgi:hypothetical protein
VRELQNSIRSKIRAFFVGFGTEPIKKSSNLTRVASFAIPSGFQSIILVQKMDQNREKMQFRFDALLEEYKKRGFDFHL